LITPFLAGSAAMLRKVRIVSLGALLVCAWAAEPLSDNPASRVVLLANSEDPDSVKIARHYATVRGVPEANIITLRMPFAESISWREFVVTIWEPLLTELVQNKWIDAIAMDSSDGLGRRKYAPNGHRLAALVICRGVPLKLEHEPDFYVEVPPFTVRSEFRTNAGSVDAELSLLALPNYPVNAFVYNPLFQNESASRFERSGVVIVARLDGPSVADAMGLVDRAVAAERTGLLGRAYVDLSARDPQGNAWLESVVRQLNDLDFDLTVDRDAATMPVASRIDAPALYFGWYAGNLDGPFTLPGFRFPPGAIALHIHSYSARTLRSVASGWTGPFVARGVTATVGNVHEPYLHLTHRPDLLLRALSKGWTLGEAAYFSLPAVSWQAVLVGDPLYRPFGVSLTRQLEISTGLPGDLAGYAVLRRMHELDDLGRRAEATALLVKAQRETPTLAVGVTLAQRLRDTGDLAAAANAVGFVPLLKEFPANQWALARETAELMEHCGRPAQAVELWRTLFSMPLPTDVRIAWLPMARAAAVAAKDPSQAMAWLKELDQRSTPPSEPGKK
jgi:uncharacterized protein (TIGR03790 family)